MARADSEKAEIARKRLEEDYQALMAAYKASQGQPLRLPESVPPTATDVIAALNDHLIEVA